MKEHTDIKLCSRCNDKSKQYRLLFELNRINIFILYLVLKMKLKMSCFHLLVVAIIYKVDTLNKVRGKENFEQLSNKL